MFTVVKYAKTVVRYAKTANNNRGCQNTGHCCTTLKLYQLFAVFFKAK